MRARSASMSPFCAGVATGSAGGRPAHPANPIATPVNSMNLRVIGLNFLAQIVKDKT
jgi:hypothetical protein